MNDESIMPFGKHQGKPMIEVPDSYLLWFWKENINLYKEEDLGLNTDQLSVMEYIEDCFDAKDLV